MFRTLVTLLLLVTGPAYGASVAPGQSVDFTFDLTATAAVAVSGYSASCAADLSCIQNGNEALVDGGVVGILIGTTRGGQDIFSGSFADTNPDGFGILSFASSITPQAPLAASTTELFMRLTAQVGPLQIGEARVSILSGTLNSIIGGTQSSVIGTELSDEFSVNSSSLSITPTPAAASTLLLGLGALFWMRRRRRQTPS